MSLLLTFMELDKLYESCNGAKDLDEQALTIKDLRAFYETSTTIDKEQYPNFHAWYDAQVKAGKYKLEAFDVNEDQVVEGIFSKKKLVSADDGLAEPTALATETAYDDISVVDLVKRAYESGMFDQLPVGRKNALMLDIYGVDKERLAGYFKKQPEFAYEVNRDSGIISHEFISDKYDVEVFDSFISMYRIPQNESLSEAIINNKETEDMNFQTILEELDRIYEEDAKTVEADVALEEDADDEMVVVDDEADEAPVEGADEEPVEDADEAEEQDEVAAQQVLKCANCGALVIKAVDEVVADEESGNVNIDESCEFCEETAGYEVLGAFIPADEEPVQESLMEGKIADSLKKIGTRLGADATTIIRALSEVLPGKKGEEIYDIMTNVENKAVLKALESGNEKVLNTCTIEDLEEIKADIERYEKEKAEKKTDTTESLDSDGTDLEEGIFDSKATKQAKYNDEIKKLFGKPITALAFEIADATEQVITACTDSTGDDSATVNKAKNVAKMIQTAKTTISKTPQSLIRNAISLGQQYAPDDPYLDVLKEFIGNAHKLQNASKNGYKAMEFLLAKVNEKTIATLDSLLAYLKKEYNI